MSSHLINKKSYKVMINEMSYKDKSKFKIDTNFKIDK